MTDRLSPPTYRILAPRAALSGTPDSVAAIDPTELPDGSMVFCIASRSNYRLDKTSTATIDGLEVLGTASGIGRWLLEANAPSPAQFVGDVAVALDSNRFATYAGPVGAINFTAAGSGHVEQNVKSWLIPANSATAVGFSADLNVNILSSFVPTEDYLVAITFFSGRCVGTARVVT